MEDEISKMEIKSRQIAQRQKKIVSGRAITLQVRQILIGNIVQPNLMKELNMDILNQNAKGCESTGNGFLETKMWKR